MTTAEDILDTAYQSNDRAKEREQATIATEDERRMEMLGAFADAKLIVTAMRTLQEASGGRLIARFETQHYSDNPTTTITIRDARIAERVISNSALSYREKQNGFRLLVKGQDVTLKPQQEDDFFLRQAAADEYFDSENGWVRMSEIKGTEPALRHIFAWAGETKDEDGKWYIERPAILRPVFGGNKREP